MASERRQEVEEARQVLYVHLCLEMGVSQATKVYGQISDFVALYLCWRASFTSLSHEEARAWEAFMEEFGD